MLFTLFGGVMGFSSTPAGSTVTIFDGVTMAGGICSYNGISLPNIALTDAGGGTYTVVKTYILYGESSGIPDITYLIDGDLP